MQKHFSFLFKHYAPVDHQKEVELISEIEAIAEIGDDDSFPDEWNVYGLYIHKTGDKYARTEIKLGTPLHTQAMNALADLADEIDDEWAAYCREYGSRRPELGDGHLQHERL